MPVLYKEEGSVLTVQSLYITISYHYWVLTPLQSLL